MAALISKPGIGGATQLSIPKDWSAVWFRGLVADLLKGADVRNAIAGPGITITGNISSPYATISAGGPGTVTFTGNVIITPTSGVGLTINAPAGSPGLVIITNGEGARIKGSAAGAANVAYLSFYDSNGVRTGYVGDGSSGNSDIYLGTDTAGSSIRLVNSATGQVVGFGPTAGVFVDMTPDTGTVTLTQTGGTTAPTVTAVWAKMGNLVMMQVPAFAAMTSNSTALTFTGVPAEIRPIRAQTIGVWPNFFIDGGVQQGPTISIAGQVNNASSVITWLKNGSATGWTNSATSKGFNNSAMVLWWFIV
jgi:hypothetical protein